MHRKYLLPLIGLALLMVACSPAAAPEAPTPPTPTDAPEPTDAPAPTEAPSPDPTAEPTAEPLTFVDALGTTIELAGPAARIVSLAPSNTELLFAAGAGDTLVARDTFSDFPAAALDAPDIGGGFFELDTETILALEPDLILAAGITPIEEIQQLQELGLAVFSVPNPLTYEELYENVLLVGRITGREAEAAAAAGALEERVDAVLERLSGLEERPLGFYQLDSTDSNAPWTAGPGNFVDTLISMAGGENVGGDLDAPWVQISVEALIVRDPDVIFVGDFTWGGVTAADVIARPGWAVMSAVQEGRVYEFDDNLVSRPGPRMVDGLETMAALLHPDRFE